MINKFQRHQTDLTLEELYPTQIGICACGCGQKLTGRRTRWATPDCHKEPLRHYLIISGHVKTIREELYKRDKGVCALCEFEVKRWVADHIIAVCNGGGGCGLENFQILCVKHHKEKTKYDIDELKIKRAYEKAQEFL